MRANVNLNPQAYSFAVAYASAKGIPLGAAISELLLRMEQAPEIPAAESRRLKKTHGLLVKARTGRAVTSEKVRETSEDDLA